MVINRLKYSDIVLTAFVVAIAAMLIVPLPTQLLDILLVLNVSFSILLLLVGLYVANSAALYTFPTILLLGTLFRLGLNVASSRLILSQGDAGHVIEAFGTFLIRGEVVVGVIIFSIVTVVNFIVISKGAMRVSEVAARFALDALPGRQMVIDNDARAGVLSSEEARKKRDDLRRESQLYGSMDGAMKFVQGDAIAGLFIIFANILGGIFMGISSGLSIQDAVQMYTVLTIGDGLVTQIPALLTSICAGIIVTRVSSSENSSLSADLRVQLFAQPAILFVTAGILVLFAMLPGIPALPFIAVASAAVGAGVILLRRMRADPNMALQSQEYSQIPGLPAPQHGRSEHDPDHEGLIIALDSGVLFRSYRGAVPRYISWWGAFRASLYADVGLLLPEIRVVADQLGAASSYRVSHAGIEMFSGRVLPDALLVEISSSHAAILGLKVLLQEEHPMSGHRVFWTPYSPHVRKMLDVASIRSYDFFEFIGLQIASFCVQHPQEFISVTDVHSLLRQVEKRHPGLIAEGFGKEFVSVPKLTEIIQELIRQGVSVRDFRAVTEGVASFCSTNGVSLDNDGTVDIARVVDHLRSNRRRQILRRFIGAARALRVISLSSEVEQILSDAELESRALPLALEAEVYEAVSNGLHTVLKPAFEYGVVPVAILCSDEVKLKVLSVTRSMTRRLFVMTFGDLDPAVPVEQVGIWNIAYR